MRKPLRGILLICLFLLAAPANAQSAANATLTLPATDSFPLIETYLHVVDSQGRFIHHLQAGDVLLLEDDQPRVIETFEEQRNGVQFVVALNPGHTFAIRNSKGDSRYDFVAGALASWAQSRRGTTLDDLSLLVTGGAENSHLADPAEWAKALQASQVDVRDAVPNLDTLFRALEVAADQPARPGTGRAVLFISPPLEAEADTPLQNLISRAREEGIPISVWMVASAGDFETLSANRLKSLADETGGYYFAYSGEEAFPNPEEFLEPLRSRYHLVFRSQALTSGSHQISLEVTYDGETIAPVSQTFDITISPPDPAFVSPSLEIKRKVQASRSTAEAGQPAVYSPTSLDLQVVIDFPDGRVRPLARTSLYVDGNLVDTNTEAPFDQFSWDLSGYTLSGEHSLRVEAVDVLGLSGSSMETLVQVDVEQPAKAALQSLSRQILLLGGVGILLAGSVALLVLVWTGRIQPYTLRVHRAGPARQALARKAELEKSEAALPRSSPWATRIHWPQRRLVPQAYAFLAQIHESDPLSSETPIPITTEEITLGSDPSLATLVLNDPSVEGLHARLIKENGDAFRLRDEGSVAGTWINYTLVSGDGCPLSHGDLVHFGRVQFRFTLRPPAVARKPVITADDIAREIIA